MNEFKQILEKNWRWGAGGWIAFVFIQSLFFKFTGSYETQYIFGVLGEFFNFPWFASYGAYLVGSAELTAAVLLFSPYWAWGALLAFEIMCGAIIFHLFTPLGVVMPSFDHSGQVIGDDAGLLFVMACLTWLCSLALVIKDWTSAKSYIRQIFPKRGKAYER